jgi:hypothetical protein
MCMYYSQQAKAVTREGCSSCMCYLPRRVGGSQQSLEGLLIRMYSRLCQQSPERAVLYTPAQ